VIQVVAKQHESGLLEAKWDIYVHDRSEEGDLLVFSNQGYENFGDAEHLVDRLFALPPLATAGQLAGTPEVSEAPRAIEPVDLFVRRRGPGSYHRMIR
jgi:hypothetical protein